MPGTGTGPGDAPDAPATGTTPGTGSGGTAPSPGSGVAPGTGTGPLERDPGDPASNDQSGQGGQSTSDREGPGGPTTAGIGSIGGSTGGTTPDGAAGGPNGSTDGTPGGSGTESVGALGPDGATESPGGATGGTANSQTGSASAGSPSGRSIWGPIAGALSAVGIGNQTFSGFGLAPTLVTTTGAVAMAMAFGLFGKKRRDGEPTAPDAELANAAASGMGLGVVTLPLENEIDAAEAMLPRWRRPSLLQARKADPIRDGVAVAARLTFDQGLVGPLDGHERRVIRYRVVRMLDTPDELRGTETGYLDRGDEVQLLEKYGAYWLVLCPDGRQGWVHNMTLGEFVEEHVQADRPVATMPLAAETWTMGESDDDADVLEAYLESRRRVD